MSENPLKIQKKCKRYLIYRLFLSLNLIIQLEVFNYPSLAMDDVIDRDIMLDLRPLSYGSATELKSIMLTPPLSDKLFIDSLRLEYFSRFLSRFDLSTKKIESVFCFGFEGIISKN